jgi:ABC-type nitrate/sulfonate/bicarbonate transport system substrate-binding protein
MILSRSAFVRSTASAAAFAALAPARAAAQPATLRLIYFPSADILPWWVGMQKGFFARENVALTLTPTPGSVYQFQHLSAGDFDIALTAIDNVIAYDEGQGQAPLPKPADFVAVCGTDDGFLHLYGRPEIKSYADLRGKSLAVDAPTTGFAFVLRTMLERNGLREGDYTLTPLGGTPQRFEKLLAGETAATLLSTPFDLLAGAKGCTNLGDASTVLGHYQGLVSATSKAWLDANLPLAARYVRGYVAALDWIFDPANTTEAIALLEAQAKLPNDLARQVYGVLTDPKTGLARKGEMDVEGVKMVLALRSTYGRPQKQLVDARKYYDDRSFKLART